MNEQVRHHANGGPGAVCPECGRLARGGDDGGRLLGRRARRMALWIWLLALLGLVVVSSPWVQLRLGYWFAVGNDGPLIPSGIGYLGFVDPPIRWIDLQKAAAGDAEAVGMLERGFAVYDRIEWGMGPRAEEDCSFQIVEPRFFVEPAPEDWGVFEGERHRYALESTEIAHLGWPIPWVRELTRHRYAYGDRRFAEEDRFVRVEDDMIHTAATTRETRWMNLVFLAAAVLGSGYAVWRIVSWRGGKKRSALLWGVGVAVLLTAAIAIVGSRHRAEFGPGRLAGNFEAVLPEDQRVWSWSRLGEIMSSETETAALARTLMDDFGEMTDPTALLALGIEHHAGPDGLELGWGLGWFRLLSVGRYTNVRQEADGTQTVVPVPDSAQDGVRFFGDGIVFLSWKRGEPAMAAYGGMLFYRNVILVLMGLHAAWRVCVLVNVRWQRRVARRRRARGLCVWCGYPCVSEV